MFTLHFSILELLIGAFNFSLSKNLDGVPLWAAVVFFIVYTLSSSTILMKFIERKWQSYDIKRKEEHAMEKADKEDLHKNLMNKGILETFSNIQSDLDKLRVKLGALRILVFNYHNGGIDVGGLPFRKYSAIFESAPDGVSRVASDRKDQLLTLYAPVFYELINKGFIQCSVVDEKYPPHAITRDYMNMYNVGSQYMHLVEQFNVPLGSITIMYPKENPKILTEKEQELVKDFSEKLVKLLWVSK